MAHKIVAHWCLTFSAPTYLHTDNGTSVKSQLFSKVMRLMSVRHTTMPTYLPESNRMERVHQLVGELILVRVADSPQTWANHLPYMQHAIN